MNRLEREGPEIDKLIWQNEDIAEIPLLMPGWQAQELVNLATSKHTAVGQLIRVFVSRCLCEQSHADVNSWPNPLVKGNANVDSTF